ncbi:MAG: HPr(Ser) kinase/phosphatase [Caldicoprobacterales bacterium]|jgi:HPr kinase/phosphorylase|nr:HPr kinase/phosphorylase [Clostridiales bacterium]
MRSISIEDMIRVLDMEVVYEGKSLSIDIETSDINRPGLQFAGFFDYFASERIQVIGKVEMTYLESMDPDIRKERLIRFFGSGIPCVLISRNMEVPPYFLEAAKQFGCPIIRSRKVTTSIIHRMINYLDSALAPKITRHGVLVDVYGEGVLLIGESGIGKSETALELIKRGHRLVADDAVEIKKVAENRLIGDSPELIRHFMEIRGIGIIDIKAMYGVGAVIRNKAIDLVVELEFWDSNKEYDRLGLIEEYTEILGAKLPKVVIPVRPGRNLAIIIEVAVRNLRLKRMGYNAAQELDNRLTSLVQSNTNNDDSY